MSKKSKTDASVEEKMKDNGDSPAAREYEAALAVGHVRLCQRSPVLPARALDERAQSNTSRMFGIRRLVEEAGNTWDKSTTRLTYYFFGANEMMDDINRDGTVAKGLYKNELYSSARCQNVRDCFKLWENLGLRISFQEVKQPEKAVIRIGFVESGDSGGCWSAVGKQLEDYFKPEYVMVRTMNFGWAIESDTRGKYAVAVHEIGHTLGFEHEHQNPALGIVWNKPYCYQYFGIPRSRGGNGWSKAEVDRNVIDPVISPEGTVWDPKSIMHYDFEPRLILQPTQYYSTGIKSTALRGGPGVWFSELDKKWAIEKYGKTSGGTTGGGRGSGSGGTRRSRAEMEEEHEETQAPQQLEDGSAVRLPWKSGVSTAFSLNPQETRKYIVTTVGKCDCQLTLVSGEGELVAANNEVGQDVNAKLNVPLEQGKRYTLIVRMAWRNDEDPVLIALV